MKKVCLTVLFVMATVSSSFAGGRNATDFVSSDLFFDEAYVCSVLSIASAGRSAEVIVPMLLCSSPNKFINAPGSFPVLHIVFWAPLSQLYARNWIVSDAGGTFIDYIFASGFLSSGFNTIEATPSALPVGDYKFTAVVAGEDGSAAISDEYPFSIR